MRFTVRSITPRAVLLRLKSWVLRAAAHHAATFPPCLASTTPKRISSAGADKQACLADNSTGKRAVPHDRAYRNRKLY